MRRIQMLRIITRRRARQYDSPRLKAPARAKVANLARHGQPQGTQEGPGRAFGSPFLRLGRDEDQDVPLPLEYPPRLQIAGRRGVARAFGHLQNRLDLAKLE